MDVFLLIVLSIGMVILAGTIRAFLVMQGLYKEPILRRFERYGDDETVFSPPFSFVSWCGLLLLYVLFLFFGVTFWVFPLLLSLIPIAYVYPVVVRKINQHPSLFMRQPLWYQHLLGMTEREERRRIAYLWLRLPIQTRLIYNTSDVYFLQWVDLVITTMA